MLPALLRKITPLWTSGAAWLVPSFMAQLHTRRRFCTLPVLIWFSVL